MSLITRFSLFILLLFPTICFGAPGAPAPSGTYSHGNTVTLSVSSPGTKSQAAPQLWDPVDGMYGSIVEGATVPMGASYVWQKDNDIGSADPASFHAHSRGVYNWTYSNATNLGADGSGVVGGNVYTGANNNYLYVSWWAYTNYSPQNPSVSNKFVRLTPGAGFSGDSDCVYWTAFHLDAHSYSTDFLWLTWVNAPPSGQWNRLEMLVNNGTSPHPTVNYTLNSAVFGNGTYQGSASLDDINGVFVIGADFSNTQSSPPSRMDFGNIYVDTTPARVELCSGSTWASRGHCEVQPATSWLNGTPGSIAVTFNQGSFIAGQTAYFYVVDNVNAASPASSAITISGTSSNITCYQDADNDLYGHGVSESVESCSAGYYIASHFTALTGDCNDSNANVNPGETEVCGNSVDDDCNESTSDICPVEPSNTGSCFGAWQ